MTAPITPDERAEWRALADAATEGPWEAHEGTVGAMTGPRDCGGCSGLVSPRHEPACFWSEVAGAAPADAAFIAAARTAVPRLLDALDTAEADLDGFANTVSQWKRRALDAEAEVARLREDAETLRGWITEHEEAIIETSDALDAAEAKVERQRDRLRAREEQVRRLRAEVTRLHALVADQRAATSPAWDEDAVTEAAARWLHEDACSEYDYAWEPNAGTFRDQARELIAVVWEHLPVKPDRETLVRAIAPESVHLTEHHPELQSSNPEAFARARAQVKVADAAARRMLALWPGESRAQVQAEALRDAAAAAVAQDNNQGDWWDDDAGQYCTPAEWLRARADRIEKGETR